MSLPTRAKLLRLKPDTPVSVTAGELLALVEAADKILREHWQTRAMWGGVLRDARGRCTYGDGVPYLWPCPTRRALTGEAAPDPTEAAERRDERVKVER